MRARATGVVIGLTVAGFSLPGIFGRVANASLVGVLFVFVLIAGFKLQNSSKYGRLSIKKIDGIFFSFIIYTTLKDVFMVLDGSGDWSFFEYQLLYSLYYVTMRIMVEFFDLEILIFSMFFTFFLVGGILAFVRSIGTDVFANFIAATLIPFSLYCLYHNRLTVSIPVLALAIIACFYYEARGALLNIICFVGFMFITRVSVAWARALFLVTMCTLFAAQYVVALNNSLFFNEILTYRPVIWNYYLELGLGSPLWGNGPAIGEVAEGASKAYHLLVNRGVADSYGVHSVYIRYFYEAGALGLLIVAAMIIKTANRSASFYWLLFFSYAISSFFTSNLLGHPSLSSTLLLLSLIAANSRAHNASPIHVPTRARRMFLSI